MSGNLLGSPKTWVLDTKNKCQDTFWALQKTWVLGTKKRKPSGLSKNMNSGYQKQMSGNRLGSPKTWVLGTKNKCQEILWALQKHEIWAPKTDVRKPSGFSKTWVFGTKNKWQEIFWALQKHEFWAPKTNVRKPSGLSKNMTIGHQNQMSGNLLGSPKKWVLGTKNKCQETFWALRNMSFGHQKQMSGNLLGSPKIWVLGTKNKCQETFWAIQKHEFWKMSKNMSFGHQKQMSGNLLGSPKTWVLGANNKCQETFWTLQKHELWAPKTNVRKPSGLSKNKKFGHQKQMSGNLLGSPKKWVLGTKNKCQETVWSLQKSEFWAPTTNVRKPSGLFKNKKVGHQKQISANLLGSPKTWVLGTKKKVRQLSGLSKNMSFGQHKQMSGNLLGSPKTWVVGTKSKCQEIFWALQKHEFWAPKKIGNLLDSPKTWVLGTKNKCQETFYALQKHEFWAPKTNVRKPSGLSKNVSFGHQQQMSGNLLDNPKTWLLGTKNKCQETFWALQKCEFWAPKTNVRKPSGLSKNMNSGYQKQMAGNLLGSPKTWVLGTNNKCQETFWALQKHEFWAPKTNVRKPSGLSKNMSLGHQKQMSGNLLGSPKTWVLGTKNKCQETFWTPQKHEIWVPKTNVRKSSGLSKNMSFGHQKQMSGNLLDSPKTWVLGTKKKETIWTIQKHEFWAPKTNGRKPSGPPKTWVLGTKSECQEILWALQKHELWAPKANIRIPSGLSKNMSSGHQKQNVRKPSGLSKNMSFGHQKQMSANLLGSPKTWVLGTKHKCQQNFWALEKHEFWAPKTNVRKSCGLSKNMRFGHQKQMSGNHLGPPKTWFLGTKNKCQETFWAFQKHEFWAPRTNVRKPSGLSKNMTLGHQKQMSGNLLGSPKTWLLGTKNKWQEIFWALQEYETWAPKKNRKPSGLSKNMSFGHQKQMSGNLLGSPKTWILGTKNKCQETFWTLQKREFWAPITNIRKPSGLSKNMRFGHQKQMSGNLLGSPKTWVLGTKNKCQETFWALQKYEFWAPKANIRKPFGSPKHEFWAPKSNVRKLSGLSKWVLDTKIKCQEPSGLSKNMSFGHQQQMSGNLLGSPETWVLGTKNKCQETFWTIQTHEFWAPKTNVTKPSGLSKNISFGHQKQMSVNLLGSPKIWLLGTKNKCQETFWALQKHEFGAPKTNVRKPSGLSKWVLDTKNKCQETFWALQKHEFWAPKTNVRKSSGLSKNMNFGHQNQMPGNFLGSPKIWVVGIKNKCQETFWVLQKYEFWRLKINIKKTSGLSKNMSFGR